MIEFQGIRAARRRQRYPLDARDHEPGPQQVEKLRRDQERAERTTGSQALGSAGKRKMAREHGPL
jgi:hypothetical protein